MKVLTNILFWGIALLILCIPLLASLQTAYEISIYVVFFLFYASIAYMMTIKKAKLAKAIFGITGTIIFITLIYTASNKKSSNQQVDPIVTTPVDEVEAQSTQGHP